MTHYVAVALCSWTMDRRSFFRTLLGSACLAASSAYSTQKPTSGPVDGIIRDFKKSVKTFRTFHDGDRRSTRLKPPELAPWTYGESIQDGKPQ